MLPLISLIKNESNTNTAYNYNFMVDARDSIFEKYPEIKPLLKSAIRKTSEVVYDSLCDAESEWFLDKTPRYYHIATELIDTLPEAKFIILSRNPAAIFTSIKEYNFNGSIQWLRKQDRVADLYLAPEKLAECIKNPNTLHVQYEILTAKPEETLNRIAKFLKIELESDIISGKYEVTDSFQRSKRIDKKSTESREVHSNSLNTWMSKIHSKTEKCLIKEYIASLNEESLKTLGYDKAQILNQINKIKVRNQIFIPSLQICTDNFGAGLTRKQRALRVFYQKTGAIY